MFNGPAAVYCISNDLIGRMPDSRPTSMLDQRSLPETEEVDRMSDPYEEAWPVPTSTTLTQQVYEVLRDRVLGGQFVPGSFVREQGVSAGLGVSRTPVREALSRLASEGFLERIPHRGFRVPEESLSDLIELYPILRTLEVLAGQQSFPRLDEESIAGLRAVNARYEVAFQRGDVSAGIDLNDEFHHMLSRGSGNRHLCDMLVDLRSEVRRLEVWAFSKDRGHEHWEESIREHGEILTAIEARDFERAVSSLERNRGTTYESYRQRFSEHSTSAGVEPGMSGA